MRPAFALHKQPFLLVSALAFLGCQNIADIRELKVNVDPSGDAAVDGGDTAEAGSELLATEEDCNTYCSKIEQGCPENSAVSAFYNPSHCNSMCSFYRKGEGANASMGSTFQCRLAQAQVAIEIGEHDAKANCQAAGVGGGGQCGTDCENYCQLYASICDRAQPNCIEKCKLLNVDLDTNAKTSFMDAPDTLQCRMAHLSAAAVLSKSNAEMNPHCDHASINPQPGICLPKIPKCTEYCSLLMRVCKDDLAQWDSQRECETVCSMAYKPRADDENDTNTSNDTLACRRYHTYNCINNVTSKDFAGHCPHAGPTGDGHCGLEACVVYCDMTAKACGATFTNTFATKDACVAECKGLDTVSGEGKPDLDHKYSVKTGKLGGNNIECRTYHMVKAFTAPATECLAAMGRAAPCQ